MFQLQKIKFQILNSRIINIKANKKMGPRQSSETRSRQQQFFSQYEIIQQLPNESIRFLQHKQNKKQYLLRQLTYNDKKQYLKAIQTIKTKMQQLKDADHITPITQFFIKQQDQYCSTFYKLYVLFQYPQRTLDDQINERNLRKNSFTQTQLWSILASCILGLSHLQKKGIKHASLKSNMIFLSQQGHIKISDPFTTGCQSNYQTLLNKRSTRHIYLSPEQCEALQSQLISPQNINSFKSDIFTLGMIVLECGLLQYQDQCYRDQYSRIHWQTLQYNKNRFRRIYSDELGNMLDYMLGIEINNRPEWIQLQNYVITDNMGKSFISEARRSAIVSHSKPISVNVVSNKINGSNALDSQQRSINLKEKNFTHQANSQQKVNTFSNPVLLINKGIGISTSKPGSVRKFIDQSSQPVFPQTKRPQFSLINNTYNSSLNSFLPSPQPLVIKPKSIASGFLPFISSSSQNSIPLSNIHPSISNLPNFSKPYLSESPIKNQLLTKNYDISPINISNISSTRPFKSIFPNPYYQSKTKVDENLVQLQQDEQTSRTTSQWSQFNGVQGHKIRTNQNQFSQKNQKGQLHQQNSISLTGQSQRNKNLEPQFFQPPFNTLSKQNQLQSMSQHQRQFQGEFVMETFKLGSRYEGYKLNGLRHGPGKFFYQDGGMYDGNWVKNKMEGYGRLYYQSGKIAYDGEWVQDQFTGHGTLYNQNPDSLNQGFDYTNFDNVQQLWTKYEGQFSQDSKNGKGALYLSNGEFFEGNFANDTAQGEGVYTTRTGNKIRGIWENNILVQQF